MGIRSRAIRLVLTSLVGVVFATACTSSGDSGTDPEGGVPSGATLKQYQAAFAGVDPIRLRMQTDGPEGALSNVGREAWADAVEQWSAGKITFEIGYSNSFVPASTEWAAGLADGRIDVGFFLPYYNPDEFPELSGLTDATFLDGNRPLSTLASTGWVTETTLRQGRYQEEAEAGGVHILTLAPSANIPGIHCRQDLAATGDFAGVPVSASGKGRFAQLEALGFAPQSIAFTELFEALERGIVSCGSTVPSALDSIGAVDLVPHAIADPEASLVGFPNFLAVGKDTWDSLPLVARQLLFDRLDVFLVEEVKARSERNSNWLDRIRASGGGIHPLDPESRRRLLAANAILLDELNSRGADTGAFVAAAQRWRTVVDRDLYPGLTPSLEEFLATRAYRAIDFHPFADALFREVLLEHRPS